MFFIKTNVFIVLSLTLTISFAFSDNKSKSGGEVFKEISTLHCLGVRWKIIGDQNKNAVIKVHYRKGKGKWLEAMPLFRTMPSPHGSNKSKLHIVPGGWMFAGSIFNLKPDTTYEVKLNLIDPDGGKAEKRVTMKTWKEPREPKGMKKIVVAPGDDLGAKVASAKPGTLIQLKAGKYSSFGLRNNGVEGKPIIIRGSSKGETIIDGNGKSCVNIYKKKHIWFEDLDFRNARYGINGNLSSNILIRRCTFRKVVSGFNAEKGGYNQSQRHFIVDNDYIGSTVWPRSKGIESICFVQATGAGHVIAYNRIQNTGDGLHGKKSWSACDIYANEFNICTDDGAETDYADFNLRVWGNVFTNVIHAVTAQPSHGGPIYIFRNFIYNATYSPFKLHNHTTGVLLLHNTVLNKGNAFSIVCVGETVTNVYTRNNLFLTLKGKGLEVGTNKVRLSDFDNDGYGGYHRFAKWNRTINYPTMTDAKKGKQIYFKNGAFKINPKTCFKSKLAPPLDADKVYRASSLDFGLAAKSDAIDKGVVLPNINSGHAGKAPDLGALEFGDKMPDIGPRTKK